MSRAGSKGRTESWVKALLVVSIVALTVAGLAAPAARAETTTTATGSTAATGAAPATTAATTGSSTAPAPGATGLGVTPAPSGWQALNPGILPPQIQVQEWPEYDTTSQETLVLVDLTVPDTVTLPFTFKYAVPKGARVTGFAMVAPGGAFDYNRPSPQFSSGGADYDLVTVTVPTYRQIHLEYYYDPGIPAQGAKSFPVVFVSPADTPSLVVTVQEPKRATGFNISPSGQPAGPDAEGFKYLTDSFTNVKDGDRIRVDVSYTKNDTDPSVTGATTSTKGRSASTTWFLALLIVLVVAVVALVAYRLFYKGSRPSGRGATGKGGSQQRRPSGASQKTGKQGPSGASRGDSPRGRPGAGAAVGGPDRFCTDCGTQLGKKDRFCPRCGHEREG